MQLLDVQPYETALQRLLRARVCSDEQLHDYHLSQAFRSLAYAVNRASLSVATPHPSQGPSTFHETSPSSLAPDTTIITPTGTSATGSETVLCRMCACALASQASLQTLVYVSTRLLCDEATAFGEGNERPSCTAAWVEALCSLGVRSSFLHKHLGVHRRLALGYLLILSGTVRAVAHGCVKGKRLYSHFVEFTQRLLDDVVPYVATMADMKDDIVLTEPLPVAPLADDEAPKMARSVIRAPSRLTVEANNALLHLFHDLALDVLEVHENERQTMSSRRMVLDRDAPSRIWTVVSILRRALLRALDWIQNEVASYRNSVSNVDAPKETQAAIEAVAVVKRALDDVFTQLIYKQETFGCSQRSAERQFGQHSKDYHATSEIMWTNTLRLLFMCRSVSNVWTYIHSSVGSVEVQHTDAQIVALIASFVSSVPALEGEEQENNVFLATTMLLSGALAAVSAAPAPSMQAALWLTDLSLTQQIHNALIQRGLRYRDENVQKLSALLSRLILYSSSNSSSFRVIADSSDQLLELLSDDRDGASQCVVGLLIHAAVERPHSILPALFRLLQHGDIKTRHNVLDVLAALPQASEDSVYGEAFTSAQMRPVWRLLSEELLLRIQDEELQIRLQSSKLFAKVWPEDVCRSLLKLATQRDRSIKRQSAAQQALRSVVEAHSGDESIVLLLIQESLALLGESVPAICATPSTPADIVAFATLHSGTLQDTVESQHETSSSTAEEGTVNKRLVQVVVLLGRHWAEGVLKWTEACVLSLLKRAMEARAPLEQELVIRIMTQIASVCGARKDGLVALSLGCLHIMKSTEEEGEHQSRPWLENVASPSTAPDSNMASYQIIAPLLFLRGCPKQNFASFTAVSEMFPPIAEMWEFLWSILLTATSCEKLSLDGQRLLLEVLCKYNVSVLLERLRDLESGYMRDGFLLPDSREEVCFVYRVGFFCVGFFLLQNPSSFHSEEMRSNTVAKERGPKEEKASEAFASLETEEMELAELVGAAQMVGRWAEKVVLPWLLDEDDAKVPDGPCTVASQRLSRSAVECLAIVTVVGLNRSVFNDVVLPFVMLPLTQLAAQCREQVMRSKESRNVADSTVEWDLSPHLLGRFELAIHIHQRALSLLRAHSLGRTLVGLYFKQYMPHLIELANAVCSTVLRLARKDIAQVVAESCHVLFLAVMATTGTRSKCSGDEITQGHTTPSKNALMLLDATDRKAILTFAVGSARYAGLPQVQSEGVKLLSALLGAAPDIFMTESHMNEAPLGEALAVLGSVALMHPDAKTRALAEQVCGALQAN
ncbi:hypothetical protein TraAM80_01719 [Trypanosoma rangeli]|uniref:Uncharacterized protein n=1 Tax=Trypanosoma rangeli TaxID=5698 RepID=A0A3R7KMG3_TRYRA|nr:uncharacterized protein TraAM80_01719 [Trypanosoma rangeli]RNF10359.1 hypothetical protein TraAM80_01719 [Trypanosoma rangeli]|eukprot:RNF10359.1 hypothetical protein TraAM80_01719 [Trypanosoma rangeli]